MRVDQNVDLSFLNRDGQALEAELNQRLRISHLYTDFVTKRMSNRMPYPERNEVRSKLHVNIGISNEIPTSRVSCTAGRGDT